MANQRERFINKWDVSKFVWNIGDETALAYEYCHGASEDGEGIIVSRGLMEGLRASSCFRGYNLEMRIPKTGYGWRAGCKIVLGTSPPHLTLSAHVCTQAWSRGSSGVCYQAKRAKTDSSVDMKLTLENWDFWCGFWFHNKALLILWGLLLNN